jgi:hypothetical protein
MEYRKRLMDGTATTTIELVKMMIKRQKKKKKTIQHHNITNLIFLLGSNSKDG